MKATKWLARTKVIIVTLFALGLMRGAAWCAVFPKCDFTPNAFYGLVPLFVPFQSRSLLAEHSWNFGDGNTSSERSPEHIFEERCNCDITHTVTGYYNSNSCDGIVMAMLVLPDFEVIGDTDGRTPLEIAFSNTTTVSEGVDRESLPWEWNFGDESGEVSTEENPTHIYAPGTYEVALSVIYNGWLYTRIKKITVSFNGEVVYYFVADSEEDEEDTNEKIIAVSPDGESRIIRLRK